MNEPEQKHHCPICQVELIYVERYPNYICSTCVGKASDNAGRKLSFFNLGIGGGFGACYTESQQPYDSHECYVEGILCYADEARFGGIVVQKVIQKPKD